MVDLENDELLVLFECLHRICETERVAVSHPAEVAVLDKIAGQLERDLAEPFDPTYNALLTRARASVLDRYRKQMGEQGWVERVPLEQV